MISCFYRLKFETPIHFGAAELGGKLENVSCAYTSDALFSALCCEVVNGYDEKFLAKFINQFRTGQIIFSDLLPYKVENEETFFYLPKPILSVKREQNLKSVSLAEVRQQATQRKKQKKISYIRASRMNEFLTAIKIGNAFSEDNNFGCEHLTQKVSTRSVEPLPYYVGNFYFNDNCGLYLTALIDDEKNADLLEQILNYVGLTGIGGKRSSGYGKFVVTGKIISSGVKNNDLSALQKMITNKNSAWQMSISSIIPAEKDITILENSHYQMKKRGGFVTTFTGDFEQKKNSVYVIGAGSCFPKRIDGELIFIDKINGHDVFRLGKGIFVGLPL